MTYATYSQRLEHLLDLIKKGRVSSPKNIAEKFMCSEKTIRNMINYLRNQGIEIEYCKITKKYFLKI
ncbi:MAG: HTH domain-containing protein [Bacteroidota bacterium]|nr:HTH domain-containing protein [Bacteroidota bacterium]